MAATQFFEINYIKSRYSPRRSLQRFVVFLLIFSTVFTSIGSSVAVADEIVFSTVTPEVADDSLTMAPVNDKDMSVPTADEPPLFPKSDEEQPSPVTSETNEGAAPITEEKSTSSIDNPAADVGTRTVAPQVDQTIDRTYTTRITPKVDTASGALTFSYPIETPTVRNLNSNLALIYNSQNTATANIYGVGWSLNIPDISRVNVLGVDKLYTADVFQSSVVGRLVPAGTAADGSKLYAPQTETPNQQLSFAFANNAWIVTGRDGTVYRYGTTASSRVDDPNNTAHVSRWYLEEMIDAVGNAIQYEYLKPQIVDPTTGRGDPVFAGYLYPARVLYATSSTDLAAGRVAPYHVDFTWVNSALPSVRYDLGFPSTLTKQLAAIRVSALDRRLRQYDIEYSEDSPVYRLVTAIVETDYDATGTVTTPLVTSFQYPTKEESSGWAPSAMIGPNTDFLSDPGAGFNCTAQYIRTGDLNGDGLGDLAACQNSFLNNGQTWIGPSRQYGSLPTGTPSGTGPLPPDMTQWGDLNQDSVVDFMNIGGYLTGQPSWTSSRYTLNDIPTNGTITIDNSGPNVPPLNYVYPTSWLVFDDGVRVLDFNGDGLTDFIQGLKVSDHGIMPYLIDRRVANTGSGPNGYGWRSVPEWGMQFAYVDLYNGYGGSMPLVPLELNGDGLIDLARTEAPQAATVTVYPFVNRGDHVSALDIHTLNGGTRTLSPLFIDINGDGLDDAISAIDYQLQPGWVQSRFTALNNGNGFSNDDYWSPPTAWRVASTPGYYENGWRASQTNTTGLLIDANGDGAPDLVGLAQESDGVRKVFFNRSAYARLPKSITLPSGGRMAITYTSAAEERTNEGIMINPRLSTVVKMVKTITWRDAFGSDSRETYTYAGGQYRGRTSLIVDPAYNHDRAVSFATVTRTRNDGIQFITHYHQGNTINTDSNEREDHLALTNYSYREDVLSPEGTMLAQKYTRYQVTELNNAADYGHWFIAPVESSQSTFTGETSRATGVATTYDVPTGNALTETHLGEVQVSSAGVMTDMGEDKITTTTTYAVWGSGTASGLLANTTSNYATSIVMTDARDMKVGETILRYDDIIGTEVIHGLLTTEKKWIASDRYASTIRTYDAVGNMLTQTDPNNHTTTIEYDARQFFPARSINAKRQATTMEYELGCAQLELTVDANGSQRRLTHDGHCRVVKEEVSDPSFVGVATLAPLVILRTLTYNDTPNNVAAITTTQFTDQLASVSESYQDGFGRVIQTRTASPNTATNPDEYVVIDTIYDELGRVAKTSLPYFGLGAARSLPTGNTSLYTSTTYDGLDRPHIITNSNGVTTTVYTRPWQESVTDANGHTKIYDRDAFGRLVTVGEVNDGATYITTYNYNPIGNLIKITDAEGNVRNFTYDGLGRRLMAEDLHAPSDTTFGWYEFTYDDGGNVLTRLTAGGQKITFSYDELNRVTTEDLLSTSGIETTTSYDLGIDGVNCENGIGRVCHHSNFASSTAYTYTSAGQVATETKTIAGSATIFVTRTTYDRAGHVVASTMPDGTTETRAYNEAGLVASVSSSDGGSTANSATPMALLSVAPCPAPTAALFFSIDPQRGIVSTFSSTPLLAGDVSVSVSGSNYGYNGFTMSVDGVPFLSFFPPPQTTQSGPVPMLTLRTGNGRLRDGLHTVVLWARNIWGQQVTATRIIATRNDIYSPCPDLTIGSAVPASTLITFPNPVAPNAPVSDDLEVAWIGTGTLRSISLQLGTDTLWTLPSGPYARHLDTRSLTNGEHQLSLTITTSTGEITTQQVVFTVSHPQLDPPTITPAPSDFDFTPTVTITPPTLPNDEAPISVFYTVDGTTPTTSSEKYVEPFLLQVPTIGVTTITVRAIAVALGYTTSSEVSVAYTVTQPTTPTTGTPGALASYVRYSPTGQPMTIIYGNVVVTTNTYDAEKQYRLTRSISVAPAQLPSTRSSKPLCPTPKQILPLLIDTLVAYPGVQPNNRSLLSGIVSFSLTARAGATALDTATLEVDGVQIAKGVKAIDGTIMVNFDSTHGRLVDGLHTLVAKVYDTSRRHSTTVITFGLKNSASSTCPSLGGDTSALKLTKMILDATPPRVTKQFSGVVVFPTRFAARKVPSSVEFRIDGKPAASQINTTGSSPFMFELDTAKLVNGLHTLDLVMTNAVGKQTIGRLNMETNNASESESISYGSVLRDATYTYDRVGNILTIADNSDTNTSKTATYTYDDLDRLLSATITNSRLEAQNYTQTYTYSPTGNMLSQATMQDSFSENKIYCYLGNAAPQVGCPTTAAAGQMYANPQAVIKIGDTIFTYDANGNMTSAGADTYQWTYRNELAQSTVNGAATNYAYDIGGSRVSVVNTDDGTFVMYPSDAYNITDQGKVTKHIFAAGAMVATIEGSGDSVGMFYQHNALLGSQGVTSTVTASLAEVSDYTPFGAPVLDDQAGSYQEQRKYIGEEYDQATGLSYLNARYYNPEQARFITQDPEFWTTNNSALLDPQTQNSYSYGRNNPLRYSDPSGHSPWQSLSGLSNAFVSDMAFGIGRQNYSDTSYQAGQSIGDAAAMIWGVAESFIGATIAGTGGGISLSGAGAAIGAPMAYAGVAVSVHGVSVSASGGAQLIKGIGNMLRRGVEGNGSNNVYNWGNLNTLDNHFERHGADFGAKSADEYAAQARKFYNDAHKNGYEKIVGQDGVQRLYDPNTRTFGSYGSDGSTKTFFKPENAKEYWGRQSNNPLKNIKLKN